MASSDVIKPADLEQLLKDLKDVVEKTRIYQTGTYFNNGLY